MGSAAPFVSKASPAHTAARLSLPIELAHDKGIVLVGNYRIGRPANGGNNAGEESPGEFPKGVTAATRQNLGATRRTEIADL